MYLKTNANYRMDNPNNTYQRYEKDNKKQFQDEKHNLSHIPVTQLKHMIVSIVNTYKNLTIHPLYQKPSIGQNKIQIYTKKYQNSKHQKMTHPKDTCHITMKLHPDLT